MKKVKVVSFFTTPLLIAAVTTLALLNPFQAEGRRNAGCGYQTDQLPCFESEEESDNFQRIRGGGLLRPFNSEKA